MFNNWWLRELTGLLFKLHPIILLALGLLDANETFLVLVVSYLAAGIVSLAKSTFVLGYDCFRVQLPLIPTVDKKIGEVVLYLLGWVLMLFFSGLLLLLFFGLLYDSVERQEYPGSIFDGKEGAVLMRTLLINGLYFLLTELLQLVRFIRHYRPEETNVWSAYLFGLNIRRWNKWAGWICAWMFVSFAFFLFMCTGGAFRLAIFSFFVFDVVLALLLRLAERKREMRIRNAE